MSSGWPTHWVHPAQVHHPAYAKAVVEQHVEQHEVTGFEGLQAVAAEEPAEPGDPPILGRETTQVPNAVHTDHDRYAAVCLTRRFRTSLNQLSADRELDFPLFRSVRP